MTGGDGYLFEPSPSEDPPRWVPVGEAVEGFSLSFDDDGQARLTMYRADGEPVYLSGPLHTLKFNRNGDDDE